MKLWPSFSNRQLRLAIAARALCSSTVDVVWHLLIASARLAWLPLVRWQVDIQPGGRGQKRVRKSFDSKADAQRFERWLVARHDAGEEWNPKKDRRTLLDLIDLWYLHHGHSLKDGESRKRKLVAICEKLGYPRAAKLTSADFAAYRLVRIQEGMSPNTLNHEQAYLTAVFNELIRQGLWNGDNPLARLRRLKIDQTELSFLDLEQINRLLDEGKASSNPSVYYVALLALSTGARWSEAEGVTQANFTPYRVTYNATKSGKSRSVPLSKEIYNQVIQELPFQSC